MQISSVPSRGRCASSYVQLSPKFSKSRRPRGMTIDSSPKTPYLDDPNKAQQPAARDSIVRYIQPKSQVSDLKRLKRERLSPPAALARWLDTNNDGEQESFWHSMRQYISSSSLSNILLEYLHRSKYSAVCVIISISMSYLTSIRPLQDSTNRSVNKLLPLFKPKALL